MAIVDPPYGIERFKKSFGTTRFKSDKRTAENGIEWDSKPNQEYFKELLRVSEYAIIWGANNFTLPETEYFIVWNKEQTVDNFSSAEYAWTNCKKPAKVFTYSIHKNNQTEKIHPTQKPVQLYRWLLQNYASCKYCLNEGGYYEDVAGDGGSRMYIPCEECCRADRNFRILDTHGGSMSIAIACYMEGFDLDVIEIDEDYFNDAVKRFKLNTAQESLF